MFDYVKYAEENNVAIAFDPFYPDGIRVIVAPAVETGNTYTVLDTCVKEKWIPGREKQILDSCILRLGLRKDWHTENAEKSRRRQERERFFREGKAMFE